jgi:hypothetical protein
VQVGGLIGLLIYVWKTWHIAKANQMSAAATAATVEEMRRAREQASEPSIVVYFSAASTSFAEVVVENFGDGTAAEVVCTFDPPLQTTMGGDAAKFFTTPKWLPPRSKLTHAFDSWVQYIGSSLPRRYSVSVTYKDAGLRTDFSGTFVLDVTAFEHMMQWERKDIHDVAKSLEKLSDRVESGISRERQLEEKRDAVWQATPEPIELQLAVAQLLGSWRLLKALEAAPHTYAFHGHHLAGMRKAAASAMAGAIRESARSSQHAAIEAVYVALHNHDFDVMTDRKPAMAALETAIEGLRSEWSQTQSSA